MCDESELDETEQMVVLAALRRKCDMDEKLRHAPFWNSDNATQALMEVDAARNWAGEIRRWGLKIDIASIRKNSDVYLDCLAEMSKKAIGVEVTELVDAEAIAEYRELPEIVGPESDPLGFPGPPVPIWDLGSFQSRLDEITRKKDVRARDSYLAKQFLLIVSDEPWLDEETVSGYLESLKLERPRHFDQIYLMLSYAPDGYGNGRYPVFEVQLQD